MAAGWGHSVCSPVVWGSAMPPHRKVSIHPVGSDCISFVGRYSGIVSITRYFSDPRTSALASINNSQLNQPAFRWLLNRDFMTPSLPTCFYQFGIYCMEELYFLSHLFIHFLHQYGCRDSCFVQLVITYYCHYLFCCLNGPTFGQSDPLQADMCVLLTYPHHFFFKHFLSILYFFSSSLESAVSSGSPGSFQKMVFQKPRSGCTLGVLIAARPYSGQHGGIHVCVHR